MRTLLSLLYKNKTQSPKSKIYPIWPHQRQKSVYFLIKVCGKICNRPNRLTQCCTQFKPLFCYGISISFKFKCYIVMQVQHTKNLNPGRFQSALCMITTTSCAQNSPPSLVCTKLFTSSGHAILFARGFSLQVCSFGIWRMLKFTSLIFEFEA